ncbi:DKNYY domain-containing protein [Capnocytophaga gingivalis]|uniref:DKNYY domain-containing protein n=1 Tax=Capnocytophaga gingivalis TaxID=1017 RepID=UPI0028EBA668|nr:DKNYY domain-containing protein [Capnocytophaga gingivalis]
MIKVVYIILFCIAIYPAVAQEDTDTAYIKPAQIQEGLKAEVQPIYNQGYLINDNYVIYQEGKSREIIHPDMKTFQLDDWNNFMRDKNIIAKDKNGVYFEGKFFPSDFGCHLIAIMDKPIAQGEYFPSGKDCIWRTHHKVYFNTEEIPEADPHTFKSMKYFNDLYHRDKNYLYYRGKRVEGADVQSIRPSYSLSEVVADKNNTYYKGEVFTYKGESLTQLTSNIFKTPHYALIFKNNRDTYDDEFVELPTYVDVHSLKGLSETYAMDKKNVYYAQTYKADTLLVPLKNKRRIRAFNGYITDRVNIFRGRNQKINLDAKTFGILGDDYLYDKKGVYKSHDVSEKIPFDYKVPVRLGKNLSYLNGNVFYNNQVYDYWEDKVYTLTQEQIEEVKRRNIYPHQLWEKTSKKSYPQSADEATFKYLYTGQYNSLGKDKNRVYFSAQQKITFIEGYDIASLKAAFDRFFLKDKDYVYYLSIRLIKSDKAELLASYQGHRHYCSHPSMPASDFYLFKNAEGYWLVKIGGGVFVEFLGTEYNLPIIN